MAKHTFITYTTQTQDVTNLICDNFFINSKIRVNSSMLSAADIASIAKKSTTDYFYVINSDNYVNLDNFDLSFAPPDTDSKLIHIWDNDTSVRLYNKLAVLANPNQYSDDKLVFPNIKSKVPFNKVYRKSEYDIIFLSYNEKFADANFDALKSRYPRAKRVNGVDGIFNAHYAAAKLAETEMFYAVDADAIVDASFDFNIVPERTDMVYVWRSQNPVNDLVYGYGGLKLFPTIDVLEYNKLPIDFTTSVSRNFKAMPEISNITKFNTDPFSAWRSGFRECTKLAAKLIHNQNDTETEYRLNVWCTIGADREFGKETLQGAIAGRIFGTTNKDKPDMLGLINNYSWLEEQYNSQQ